MKLYKYCKIPDCQHWESMLNEIKFTQMFNLNDPFEGFLRATDDSGKVANQRSSKAFIASFSNVRPFTPVSKVKNGKKESTLYMWSHYGDALNGICLEYKFDKDKKIKLKAGNVRYCTNPPKEIDCFVKYVSWNFEEEYRFEFIHDKTNLNRQGEVFKNNQDCGLELSTIYLGVRISGKDKRLGIEAIRANMLSHPFIIFLKTTLPDMDIFICARHRNSFKIVKLVDKL